MNKLSDRIEEQKTMIDDCMKREYRLDDWDRKFIRSVYEYTKRGGFLSDKQHVKLNEIWDNITKKG